MAWFTRSNPALPASVRSLMGITRREKVLAWAPLARSRGHVALTVTHVHAALAGEQPVAVAWDAVAHASWDDPLLAVVFDADGRQLRMSLDLAAPGDVPAVLRERVTSTVVFEGHRLLTAEVGARFIARRAVGAGPVRWSVVFDEPEAAADPANRALADDTLSALRADLGL